MKLSISTLGCPDWGFDRVVQAFEDLGVDIEVRGVDGEMEAGRIARFSPARAQETKALLAAHGAEDRGLWHLLQVPRPRGAGGEHPRRLGGR